MGRTVKVQLQAEVGQYKRGVGEAKQATDKLSDALDDVDGKATGMGTTLDRVSAAAADDFDEVARHARKLDDQIEQTARGIQSLAKAFAETGNPKILAAIKQQQQVGRELINVRSLLPKNDELRKGGAAMAGQIGAGFGATLIRTLPAAANPAMMGVAAGAAPVFISAFSSALAAGAGVGLIGVGLAAVAKDPVVKLRGAEVGKNFTDALQREAREAFGGPVMGSLNQLDAAGKRVTAQLGDAFDMLAPHVEPFTQKVIGAGEAITGSLANAARKSGPAIDGLGDSVTLLGEGASYFIDTVSDGGPQAADNLRLIAGATADVAKYSAEVLNTANKLSSNAWITGPLLPLLKKHYRDAAAEAQRLKDEQAKIPPELELTAAAARGQRDALSALSKELRAQTDPAFALLNAQDGLRKAQNDAAAATKKHGSNSVEAREATRKLALAALDLQGKAGALGGTFSGKLTPSMVATYRAAGLTEAQISDVEGQFIAAKKAGDKYDGKFTAQVTATGVQGVFGQFNALLVQQRALQSGLSLGAARAAMQKDLDRNRARAYAEGGAVRGPGTKTSDSIPALLSNNEHVWTADEVSAVGGHRAMKRLRDSALAGELPAFARGGAVWPFPATAAKTRVPSLEQVLAKVAPSGPSGATGPWMERLLEQRFKVAMISGFRRGSRTLSGNLSYHARNRAVDFPPMRAMAKFMYDNYKPRLKEAITPYQEYNVHNGRDRRWTGAVWNQHNFAGGNAHNHFAMAKGGVIGEPVVGVGRSGATYSFAERGPERVLSTGQTAAGVGGGSTTVNLNVTAPVGSHPADIGRAVVASIGDYLKGGGELRVRGQKVF